MATWEMSRCGDCEGQLKHGFGGFRRQKKDAAELDGVYADRISSNFQYCIWELKAMAMGGGSWLWRPKDGKVISWMRFGSGDLYFGILLA